MNRSNTPTPPGSRRYSRWGRQRSFGRRNTIENGRPSPTPVASINPTSTRLASSIVSRNHSPTYGENVATVNASSIAPILGPLPPFLNGSQWGQTLTRALRRAHTSQWGQTLTRALRRAHICFDVEDRT